MINVQIGNNVTINNITIGNGQVVNEAFIDNLNNMQKGQNKKINERKLEDARKVESIIINSTFVKVDVSVSDSQNVEAHLYGYASGDIKFDFRLVNKQLQISVKSLEGCYNCNLNLDVIIPKKLFESITVESGTADITLHKGVVTDSLEVTTKAGKLETQATFTQASITTLSGDVDFYIDATKNIKVQINTMSGDVSAKFNHIRHMNISTRSKSGDVVNYHKTENGYVANVQISTMSGDIRIR